MPDSPPPLSAADAAALRDTVAHFDAGRLDEAERGALALRARVPGNPDVRHLVALIALRRGRPAEALAHVDGLLREWPRDAFALNTRGAACQALGRREEAIAAYRAAVDADPGYADAAGNLGVALLEARRQEEALRLAGEALSRMPGFLPLRMVGGHAALGLGRLEEARAHYAGALELSPGHPAILGMLGDVLHRLGRDEEALAAFDSVVAAQPDAAGGHNNRGTALLALGRAAEAEAAFRRATELDPGLAAAWHNLACALQSQGRHEDCARAGTRAIGLAPGFTEAALTLSAALNETGRAPEAESLLRGVLERSPGHARALVTLAGSLGLSRRHGEAVEAARQAAAAAPRDAAILGAAAGVLAEDGRFEEALARYDEAIALAPGDAAWRVLRALALPVVAPSVEAIATAREALAHHAAQVAQGGLALADPERRIGATGFYLAYHGEPDLALQREVARMHLALHPALAWQAPGAAPRARRGRRLRVGFLSAFLHNHTIGKLFRGFVAGLDRARFEVVVLHARDRRDAVREAIDASADAAFVLPTRLAPAREAVAQAALDVLFYPEIGMHAFTYFLSHARLAPVQVTGWGHPDTTGVPAIDHFVSAACLEPEGAQAHYGERLARFERLPVFYERPAPPPALGVRARLGLPPGAALYACPQSLFKFHPAFDGVLADLLRADPEGYLALVASDRPGWNEALRARLARAMPEAAGRVRFLPFLPEAEFMDLLAGADAVLDPAHFGGGNSTYEALGLGVPVVTMPGPLMRGRVTLGCYRQMGMGELVAGSPGEYVALAVRLARDAAFRESVRARVRESSGALFGDRGALREMEAFLGRAFDEAGGGGA